MTSRPCKQNWQHSQGNRQRWIASEQKAAFDTAKAELELGISGVQKALGVLRDYYHGSAALVQSSASFNAFMQQPAAPKKHSAASGAGGSILDILEVCESDFTKNLAAEEQEEADAVSTYESTTQENKMSTTMKSQDVKYKTKEYKTLDKSIADLSGDRVVEQRRDVHAVHALGQIGRASCRERV